MAELSREDVFGTGEFLPKLVEELDAVFPQLNPSPSDDLASIMYLAGQRRVVEYLQNKLDENV